MGRLRHILITANDPAKTVAFWQEALGLSCVGEIPGLAYFLSDGYVNISVARPDAVAPAHLGKNGPGFEGIHHIGFQVDDIDKTTEQLHQAHARLLPDDVSEAFAEFASDNRQFEMKWESPDGVLFDISHSGWKFE